MRAQVGVDLLAERVDRAPLRSLYGSVTRGASQTRRTDMWCSKVVSHGSSAPLIGAADDGSGEQASGMWPSPA